MPPSTRSSRTASRSSSKNEDAQAARVEKALDDLDGFCCETMCLVTKRMDRSKANVGLRAGLMINLKKGSSCRKVACYFPKAAKDDFSKFGKGTPYANASYSLLTYCPWCGKKLNEDAPD